MDKLSYIHAKFFYFILMPEILLLLSIIIYQYTFFHLFYYLRCIFEL